MTTDVFMRLMLHISDQRTRLLEIFRQEDKDRDYALSGSELGNLIRRVMPNLSPSQLRYLLVMLDNNGDGAITYKELCLTIKTSKASNLAMKAREELELVDVLRKLAFMQARGALTTELRTQHPMSPGGGLGYKLVHSRPQITALTTALSWLSTALDLRCGSEMSKCSDVDDGLRYNNVDRKACGVIYESGVGCRRRYYESVILWRW